MNERRLDVHSRHPHQRATPVKALRVIQAILRGAAVALGLTGAIMVGAAQDMHVLADGALLLVLAGVVAIGATA